MKRDIGLKRGVALGLAAVASLGPCVAEPGATEKSAFVRFAEQDYLFGDWGGRRTWLKEHGVDFEFIYFAAVPSNLDGGLKEGSEYEGAFMMLLDLYSDKLAGYPGGQFHAAGLSIHNGDEFSANYIGDLNKVSMLDFPDNLNLWELWYEQKFLDNKVALKFGQLAIDRDFIVPEYYNSLAGISLLNQTFFYPTMAFNVYDQPFFPVGNHALASTPYGTPGVRLRVDPCPHAYVQVGAYDGNPDRTRGSVDFELSDEEGALIYAELGLRFNQTPEAEGPPGNLKIGGYYHTDDFYNSYDGAFVAFDNALQYYGQPKLSDILAFYGQPVPPEFTNPGEESGNYGLYLLADQTLWREVGKEDPAQQGLVGFFRVAWAPADRNLASFGIDGGLVYKGLIPTRDWDTLSLGLSYLKISDDIRDAQRSLNSIVTGLGEAAPFAKIADYEGVLELSYKAQLTAWWTLQVSAQRVFHPGGRVAPPAPGTGLSYIPDAWAFIVQAVWRF